MKKLILVIAASLLFCAGAFADSVCSNTTFNTGTSSSCNFGGLDFSNFVALDGTSGQIVNVPVLVSASIVGGNIVLDLNPLQIIANQPLDVQWFFTVTGLNGTQIGGVDLGLLSVVSGGVIETVCSAPTSPASACAPANILANLFASNPTSPSNVLDSTFAPTGTIYINKDIGVIAGGSDTGFTQSFHIVPEPSSLVFLGTGLLGVGTLLRRRLLG